MMTLKDTVQEAQEIEAFTAPEPAKPAPKPVDLAEINSLHELLALAIGDFEQVLGDRRYVINMGEWHLPQDDGKCQVCLAGSVLAMTAGTPRSREVAPISLGFTLHGRAVRNRLHALNELRDGGVRAAWQCLTGQHIGDVPDVVDMLDFKWCDRIPFGVAFASNRRDGRRLLAHMKALQRDLAEAGI